MILRLITVAAFAAFLGGCGLHTSGMGHDAPHAYAPPPPSAGVVFHQQAHYRPAADPTRVRQTGSEFRCPALGSRKFHDLNPRPRGQGWVMTDKVPGKPCGGWKRLRLLNNNDDDNDDA